MNTDIRIKIGIFAHRKTKKLRRALGDGAFVALLTLWGAAANSRPDGVLRGMSVEDIALDADWGGDPEEFVSTLVACGWLDETPEGYALHDWAEHQGFVVHSEARSASARKAAEARWKKTHADSEVDATRNAESCEAHAERMRPAMRNHAERNAPNPNPTPTPNPKPEAAAAQISGEGEIARAREAVPIAAAADALSPVSAPHLVALPPALPGACAPDAERMSLARAANLYRNSFAGKSHVQVAPMVLAKLSVLISQYSAVEMEQAFDAAATAGASSLVYLERTLEGKRADAQGVPRARDKPLSKRGEALQALGAWAQGDWLREEIAAGMALLLADGERKGLPAADTITLTAANYEAELRKYQLTEEERGRVRQAFEQARLHVQNWPQTRELCDHLPRRRPQEALAEEPESARRPAFGLAEEFANLKRTEEA